MRILAVNRSCSVRSELFVPSGAGETEKKSVPFGFSAGHEVSTDSRLLFPFDFFFGEKTNEKSKTFSFLFSFCFDDETTMRSIDFFFFLRPSVFFLLLVC